MSVVLVSLSPPKAVLIAALIAPESVVLVVVVPASLVVLVPESVVLFVVVPASLAVLPALVVLVRSVVSGTQSCSDRRVDCTRGCSGTLGSRSCSESHGSHSLDSFEGLHKTHAPACHICLHCWGLRVGWCAAFSAVSALV